MYMYWVQRNSSSYNLCRRCQRKPTSNIIKQLWTVLQYGCGCLIGDEEEEGAEDDDAEGAELDEVYLSRI